ncbi:MAG: hypothetical protein QM723_31920 [Myxococcaceae bacterium]
MKRTDTEDQARAARDLGIECMVLLGDSVHMVKKSCVEPYFVRYRRACANLMGECITIINRAANDFPALKPSEEEWNTVAAARVPVRPYAEEGPFDQAAVDEMLNLARKRFAEIEAVAPGFTVTPYDVEGAFRILDEVFLDFARSLIQ